MRSHALVLPSVREGWGLVVTEANSLGTPCVGYDVSGLRDSVKDGETGLLAEAGNVDDLADKIIMFLTDDTLRERLSRNALDYSRRFSWDESAKVFLEILRSAREG
jgi:glycosyltransferase involved in cell wall biosynthesis